MQQVIRRLKNLLRQAVAFAAMSNVEARRALRQRGAKLRRRIVRITAAKPPLTGRTAARQGANGCWPAH